VGQVSDEDITDVFDTFEKMNQAQKERLLQSANYVEAGGLTIALKETATAGEKGIEYDIEAVHQEEELELHEAMYGETEGRFLVTIKAEDKEQFEKLFEGKFSKIGVVKGDELSMKKGDKDLLKESAKVMLKEYHKKEYREAA
jgi:phosphoribosylformylglycinamidine synthase